MFLFPRGIHPVPARSRAYSSFFSNKAGGGRYFNPAKSSKPVVATPAANKGKADASSPPLPADAGDGLNGTPNNNTGDHQMMKINDQTTSSSTTSHTMSSHDSLSSSSPHSSTPTPSTSVTHPQHTTLLHHPSIDSNDFKLNQFFSLHRPLLLLSHPISTFFEQPSDLPQSHPLSSLFADTARNAPPASVFTLDNPPEASPEADADAARQLARALVLNRVGGTVAWESTLRHLGLDVNLEEGRASLKEQCEREWEDIMMDSTKRKRRSKMKKHK